jgi:hypothetical protein
MDTLKKALSKLVSFGENLEGALKDHKVTFVEGMTLSANLGMAVFFIIQNIDAIHVELDQLSEADETELINFIKNELDLTNDRAEAIIQGTIDMIASVIMYIETIKKS